MGKRYIKLPPNQAHIIQNNYSCSQCWNRVNYCHDEKGDYLDCGTQDCKCFGLVTNKYIEYQLQVQEVKARIAIDILQEQFEWLRPVKRIKSQSQTMHELGF